MNNAELSIRNGEHFVKGHCVDGHFVEWTLLQHHFAPSEVDYTPLKHKIYSPTFHYPLKGEYNTIRLKKTHFDPPWGRYTHLKHKNTILSTLS